MSEVVISGLAGKFPQCDSVEEFKEKLLKKVYLVGDPENRIKYKSGDFPQRYGLMKNLDKYDNHAFSTASMLAHIADPQGRLSVECVYEAIIDSGINPDSLIGSNTGVYVGCFNYDSLEHWMCNVELNFPFSSGSNMGFSLSNHTAYAFGFKGPSSTGKFKL
jgi:fatty acid synthase, animal type